VPAAEAVKIGLFDRSTDGDVVEAALALADEFAKASLPAQLAGVRSVNAAYDLPFAEGARVEIEQEQGLFEHGEAAEGIDAFINKRTPNFG
jgi:enoyl-CoA hydratase/carnithine racemase